MFGFVITADDRPGMVATATEAAARAGVNLQAISGMANGTTGMLALIGDDDAKLRAALAGTGLQVREVEPLGADRHCSVHALRLPPGLERESCQPASRARKALPPLAGSGRRPLGRDSDV